MKHRSHKRGKALGWMAFFLGPALLVYTVFWMAPIALTAVISLTDWKGTTALSEANFVGLKNYVSLLSDSILKISIKNNLLYGALMLLLVPVLSFVIAYVIENFIRRKAFFRTLAYLPAILPTIVVVLLWKWIYNPQYGLLNQLLQKIGILALYNHLTGSDLEYFTLINTQGAVVLGMVYNYLPFMILPIYSVIVKLDHSLLEAARDLGANTVTVFRKVILPLSLPGVLSGITMVFVPSVSTFAISRMLGGGTELLLGDLIERQFLGGAYNPQLGAAISLVMMLVVVVCMLVMNRFGEGEEQAVML